MKKALIIVESPAKIKTISKFLGKDFKIMSTIGHIKDLPSKTIGVTMGDEIKIDISVFYQHPAYSMIQYNICSRVYLQVQVSYEKFSRRGRRRHRRVSVAG